MQAKVAPNGRKIAVNNCSFHLVLGIAQAIRATIWRLSTATSVNRTLWE
jgi:hypothetical protein